MPDNPLYLEFLFGGISTCGAALITNPLEVVKTRMQLQGELQARGHFTVHYRNVFHAFITIARHEGLTALQKGLGPSLIYQFIMNGFRLGSYQVLCDSSVFKGIEGKPTVFGSIVAGAISGSIGGFCGSPIYMVKTHMQSKASPAIAVGHQNDVRYFLPALCDTFKKFGIRGLWRGSSGAVGRVMIGSATQLATFSQTKQYIITTGMFHPHSWMNAFVASMISGVAVVACMTPFDVVSTRLYNQPTQTGKGGILYAGITDCFRKIYKKEGIWGFYKGWAASLFRLGPHTVLSLMFWDQTRSFYLKWSLRPQNHGSHIEDTAPIEPT